MATSQGALTIIFETDKSYVFENYRNLRTDPSSGWITFDYVEPISARNTTYRFNPRFVVSLITVDPS
jgi:predicted phage gp36 major capsid-like protein